MVLDGRPDATICDDTASLVLKHLKHCQTDKWKSREGASDPIRRGYKFSASAPVLWSLSSCSDIWDSSALWNYIYNYIYIFKGCRPRRRPRKNRQGSQANWHKNSSVLRTLRLSTFFLCILLWNIFDRFEFSFVNGFFMIYWLSWSRRSLCMSIQVRAMWSGGVAVWVAVFDLGWTYNKWHYHKGIFTLWSWTKLHCVARGCLARNCWFVLMVFSFHFFLGWCVWPPLRES